MIDRTNDPFPDRPENWCELTLFNTEIKKISTLSTLQKNKWEKILNLRIKILPSL